MADINLTHADLNAVLAGTLVNEEVLQQIIDVSRLPLVFSDAIGSGSVANKEFSWTQDRLQTPAVNKATDGEDVDQQDAVLGQRVANQEQIRMRGVKLSNLADAAE